MDGNSNVCIAVHFEKFFFLLLCYIVFIKNVFAYTGFLFGADFYTVKCLKNLC